MRKSRTLVTVVALTICIIGNAMSVSAAESIKETDSIAITAQETDSIAITAQETDSMAIAAQGTDLCYQGIIVCIRRGQS